MGHNYLNIGMTFFCAIVVVACAILAWLYNWVILVACAFFLAGLVYWPWDWRRIVVDLEADTVTVQRVLFCFGCPDVYPLTDYKMGCAKDWSEVHKSEYRNRDTDIRRETTTTKYYHKVMKTKWTRSCANSSSKHVNEHARSVQEERARYQRWLNGNTIL